MFFIVKKSILTYFDNFINDYCQKIMLKYFNSFMKDPLSKNKYKKHV